MNIGFTEISTFARVREELFGGDEEYRRFQNFLMDNPRAGNVIPGLNGLRKVRVGIRGQNTGKRGGIRVVYLYLEDRAKIVFFAAYAKNVADDLTPQQKRDLAAAVQREKDETR